MSNKAYKTWGSILFIAIFCTATVSIALNYRSLYARGATMFSDNLLACDVFFIFLSFNACLYLGIKKIQDYKWFKYAFMLIVIPLILIFLTFSISFLSKNWDKNYISDQAKDFLKCYMSDLIIVTVLLPFATLCLFKSDQQGDAPSPRLEASKEDDSKTGLMQDARPKYQQVYKIIASIILLGTAGVSFTYYWIIFLDYQGSYVPYYEWTIIACNGVFIFCTLGSLLAIWIKQLADLDWPRHFFVIFTFPFAGINFIVSVEYLNEFWTPPRGRDSNLNIVMSQLIILTALLPIGGILRWKIMPEKGTPDNVVEDRKVMDA